MDRQFRLNVLGCVWVVFPLLAVRWAFLAGWRSHPSALPCRKVGSLSVLFAWGSQGAFKTAGTKQKRVYTHDRAQRPKAFSKQSSAQQATRALINEERTIFRWMHPFCFRQASESG